MCFSLIARTRVLRLLIDTLTSLFRILDCTPVETSGYYCDKLKYLGVISIYTESLPQFSARCNFAVAEKSTPNIGHGIIYYVIALEAIKIFYTSIYTLLSKKRLQYSLQLYIFRLDWRLFSLIIHQTNLFILCIFFPQHILFDTLDQKKKGNNLIQNFLGEIHER